MAESLLDKLKASNLQARKDREVLRSNLLGSVIAEAVLIGKNDRNRLPSDAETLAVIRKFLKGITESIQALRAGGRDATDAEKEKSILEEFLPKQLGEQELKAALQEIIAGLPEKGPKAMGAAMAALKAKYEGAYDGKTASTILKDLLA